MIEPSNWLLEAAAPHAAKLVFFVDTTYLLRLQAMARQVDSCARDYAEISRQLVGFAHGGHHILPHLHPHWIDAEYTVERNEWRLVNSEKYRFASLRPEEQTKLFDESIALLKDIVGPSVPGYRIDGYRAGGWCIQPFADFRPCFERHGIVADFSVIPGCFHISPARRFDFSAVSEATPYRFSDNPCHADSTGRFVELPISVVELSPLCRLADKVVRQIQHRLLKDHTFHRGSGLAVDRGIGRGSGNMPGFDLVDGRRQMLAVELLNLATLPLYRRMLDNNEYLHFNSHPKMISRHNMRAFSAFLRYAFQEHAVKTSYRDYLEP